MEGGAVGVGKIPSLHANLPFNWVPRLCAAGVWLVLDYLDTATMFTPVAVDIAICCEPVRVQVTVPPPPMRQDAQLP
jgi:hypothetical protein